MKLMLNTGFRKTAAIVFLGIAASVTFYYIGYYRAGNHYRTLFTEINPIRDNSTSYEFTRPLLAYSFPDATDVGEYVGLNEELLHAASLAKSEGINRASIYFRDLEGSAKIGIQQSDIYYPASLLKVPALIAYYAQAEQNPSVLGEVVVYDPSSFPDIPFGASSGLVPGRAYTVQELINHMIQESDNGATFTLLERLDPVFLAGVYAALGIPNPDEVIESYQISARTYGFFFRILYNATYLSPEYSDKALRLLSQTSFTDGLTAGIPAGIVVAHKWGEHVIVEQGVATGVELHDCGIIYYPAHPYLLCVMTSAANLKSAETFIAKVSRITYAAVQRQYAGSTQ